MVKGSGTFRLPQEIRDRVLEAVTPSEEEMQAITASADRLLERIRRSAERAGIRNVEAKLAGSIAKGTITGTPDIDIFLIFSRDVPKDLLEEQGLMIGRDVLDSPRKKYTQHPYITGRFENLSCDIVPCSRIERGEKVITAVDRTPHHTEYVSSRMNGELRRDAVLLKAFLKGVGAYGAENTVSGFSGYLCELLILRFGSFEKVISAFASMEVAEEPPTRAETVRTGRFMKERQGPILFDGDYLLCEAPKTPEEYIRTFGRDALIVIDPVDPGRNVAAPVSDQILAHTALMSGRLMEDSSIELFHPWNRRPYEHTGELSGKHGGTRNALWIPLPDDVPDKVMTQARSFILKAVRDMERRGDWKVAADLILLFPRDAEVDGSYLKARYVHSLEGLDSEGLVVRFTSVPEELEAEMIHYGPPRDNRRAGEFRKRWKDRTRVDEESGRLYVIVSRKLKEPIPIFLSLWGSIRKGPSFEGIDPEIVENQLINEVIWEASERLSS